MSRDEVRRARKIAGMRPEAKAAAKAAGIDDNQTALLKVAAAPDDTQIEAVAEIIEPKAKTPHAPGGPEPAAIEPVSDNCDDEVRANLAEIVDGLGLDVTKAVLDAVADDNPHREVEAMHKLADRVAIIGLDAAMAELEAAKRADEIIEPDSDYARGYAAGYAAAVAEGEAKAAAAARDRSAKAKTTRNAKAAKEKARRAWEEARRIRLNAARDKREAKEEAARLARVRAADAATVAARAAYDAERAQIEG